MNDTILDGLRYKCEGTDLDFKSAQYRFVKGTEAEKAELLKDILAIANAWRDGTGYILIGFKDRRPHPAEVVGIVDQLDDASVQQFVHGKVKPKLEFRYEEQLYDSKTIGVIAIPKQPRPFYLANAYGALKSNVVYVRRGSCTDEAEPPEVAKMVATDAGSKPATIDVSVLDAESDPLSADVTLEFLRFASLPDYESRRSNNSYAFTSIHHDNRDFWREAAEYFRVHLSKVELQFELANRSEFALSNTKLEVSVEPIDGQSCQMVAGADLPDEPETQWDPVSQMPTMADVLSRREARLLIDDGGKAPICHARFGTLLPGETSRSSDLIAIVLSGPGRVGIRFRVLASELPSPIEGECALNVSGMERACDLDGLRRLLATQPP